MVSNYEKLGVSEVLLKNIQEKSMEKRSQATKQVQTEIEDLHARNELDQIKNKIDVFKKLTEDYSQANFRRAGLYGLSAIGVALYQRNVSS